MTFFVSFQGTEFCSKLRDFSAAHNLTIGGHPHLVVSIRCSEGHKLVIHYITTRPPDPTALVTPFVIEGAQVLPPSSEVTQYPSIYIF